MMNKDITTTMGTINLNDISFVEDTLDVFIGIESVSDEIQNKINEAVEIAKADHMALVKEHFSNKDLTWTDSGVETNLSLHIIVEDKAFSYRIEIDITDREDERVWTSASVDVDLSEYQNELKKVIVKAMIDNFFWGITYLENIW